MASIANSHIEKHAGEPARLSRFSRIRVSQIVMDYLAHGWSPEEMCRHYPHLTPAEAHAAMAYYYDHQEEVETEIQEEQAKIQSDRSATAPSPFQTRMQLKGSL